MQVYETESTSESTVLSAVATSSQAMSMKEKLDLVIKKKKITIAHEEISDPKTTSGLLNTVRKEMAYFKEQNIKGKYLNKLQKYISAVRPTSVESERAFSAAGLIGTRYRTSLNNETLNVMCFLRAYFNKQFMLLEKN